MVQSQSQLLKEYQRGYVVTDRDLKMLKPPSKFESFKESLMWAGHNTFESYLESEEWYEFKADYRESDLPQTCLVCSEEADLHHWRMVPIDDQCLEDCIPLCDKHKKELFTLYDVRKENIIDTMFLTCGLTKQKAEELMKPFMEGMWSYER